MNKDITLEDLGYIAKAGNYVGLGETIIYLKKGTVIKFSITNKTIEKYSGMNGGSSPFTLQELQAIFNEYKNRGWLDE